eukprot:CAMPEP_0204523168 /NCGR_PEP_ID=MMETSP0661-20131031/6707_1 /ASSEMBLY_ACC=CAM_ASM_000606 /TAXON_ID=109239 /ORGANISM="Alexandrium margalefi, Strain AMGDE01CS-322" /LENGTH=32 /DNA_ID= /DNA_START= /DNA_END= /DNA_ORIENTATION=
MAAPARRGAKAATATMVGGKSGSGPGSACMRA